MTALDYRERALSALDKLPPFSPILNRLIASLAREDASFSQIAQWIERDTVLAGNVLRVVNSPLYGHRGTVSSVRHGIAMMGQTRLRNTILGLSVAQFWKRVSTPPGWPLAEFNSHSVAVAILADLLAERTQTSYAEGAFAAGLFHDLGKLLLAVSGENAELLWDLHAELSAEALARWNLPASVQEAVRFHHAPRPSELSCIIYVADLYVNQADATVLASLGIQEDQISGILDEFHAESEVLVSLLS